MAVSNAQIKATGKYNKANYDNISIRVKKGKKEEYKKKAESKGKSLARYICDLIEADPLPDEIQALQEAEEDTSDPIPHDAINW